MFDNEWVIDYSASEKITLSGIWLLENGQLLELLNLGENTMKKLEIKKTEARKIHIKKVLLDEYHFTCCIYCYGIRHYS